MTMTPEAFIAKWQASRLREDQGSQEHFLDLCRLVGHPTPAEADPDGKSFVFERGAKKTKAGAVVGNGWADVWYDRRFGWEYKGKHKDLEKAYEQLAFYRESLNNPPLLVVCDMERFVIRTNFTGYPVVKHEFVSAQLTNPFWLTLLRNVFHHPERLTPELTTARITEKAAEKFAGLADVLRKRRHPPRAVAKFLDRIVFCLFAEDVDLLPAKLFSNLLKAAGRDPKKLRSRMAALFRVMATGGAYGDADIKHFNGGLFDETDDLVLEFQPQDLEILADAAALDWSGVDASIFGTLFERGLDPDSRAELGAHYTSRDDIETLIEPVVMAPLRREWAAVQAEAEKLDFALGVEAGSGAAGKLKKSDARRKKAVQLVEDFHARLLQVRVLDPACGSGNFLFVTLQMLKDLEKEVRIFQREVFGEQILAAFVSPANPFSQHRRRRYDSSVATDTQGIEQPAMKP